MEGVVVQTALEAIMAESCLTFTFAELMLHRALTSGGLDCELTKSLDFMALCPATRTSASGVWPGQVVSDDAAEAVAVVESCNDGDSFSAPTRVLAAIDLMRQLIAARSRMHSVKLAVPASAPVGEQHLEDEDSPLNSSNPSNSMKLYDGNVFGVPVEAACIMLFSSFRHHLKSSKHCIPLLTHSSASGTLQLRPQSSLRQCVNPCTRIRTSPTSCFLKMTLEVEKQVIVEKEVFVPEICTVERIVPQIQTVEVMVPEIRTVERMVPQTMGEKQVRTIERLVPQIQTVEKQVFVPEIRTIERIVPQIQTVEKLVPVPEIRTVDKIVRYVDNTEARAHSPDDLESCRLALLFNLGRLYE
eukprot:5944241-Amphidinium_carterae.1